jgi:hypothetical protein
MNDPVFPKDKQHLLDSNTCLNCGEAILASQRNVRGNHIKCHKQILRAIEFGKITDDEAVEVGLFANNRKSGRKRMGGTMLDKYLQEKEARSKQ